MLKNIFICHVHYYNNCPHQIGFEYKQSILEGGKTAKKNCSHCENNDYSSKVGTSEPLLYSVDAIDVFTLETLYSVENNAKIYVR